MTKEQILGVAVAVRAECVRFAAETKDHDFRREDLGGMCASASLVLKAVLENLGFAESHLTRNDDHAWLLLFFEKDWFHLDITASQFGGPKIYFSPEPFRVGRGQRETVFCGLEECLNVLNGAGWGSGQVLGMDAIFELAEAAKKRLDKNFSMYRL